jgi:hypothetical protein
MGFKILCTRADLEAIVKECDDLLEASKKETDYLKKFKRLKILSLIYTSNRLEQTNPKGASEHFTNSSYLQC